MSYSLLNATKILEHLQTKLSGIRTGRVSASILDSLEVEAYGANMKIVEIATVTAPEPAQLMITPFDKSLIPNIAKAINNSNLGVNPNDDGAGIRLSFPPLTEETRAVKAKEVGKELEEARIMLRSYRQDLMKAKKREKEADEISEDDLNRFEKQLQTEVDALNKELQELAKKKEAEIMTV